ncbi:class I SAM-dependent methyltransferase [Oxynema aestuarii]|uniref:Class I SAM-dependent methyltransferase n=1 Tax=Oxynema aestuarii AP17 TaxID=2064643 RepID=A0A6H1U0T9_9CYAN|nr:class I SAM-dependent methyltransferase [Oxynema aestuarii]QIZ72488.1 class I SAM-dependent methyltransferase [Oxynema aestuarii AP17]
MKSALVKILGFPATLIHGDTLVLDRWLWLKERLPQTSTSDKLIDIGCGTGAFTIGAALLGYEALGLSWDERNQSVAKQRALLCGAKSANFEVLDVRKLDRRQDLIAQFDLAISLEVIEHILDDRKLMRDIANCLKPGGRLLLTTPNYDYKPITAMDKGPFPTVETGWHVRKGYTEASLINLCKEAGFVVDSISFCSGFFSQKTTFFFRFFSKIHPLLGWSFILPLRGLPPLVDPVVTKLLHWPEFSICLEAHKPNETEA